MTEQHIYNVKIIDDFDNKEIKEMPITLNIDVSSLQWGDTKMDLKRCPNDCESIRKEFPEGSKQRNGIFHDNIGQCAICGQLVTENDLK